MYYTFLSGGTGTPKLLQGFRSHIQDHDVRVICNSGDDLLWKGLRVCPDLDTVIYLFADLLDTEKFWGRKSDTFNTLNTLTSFTGEEWFGIGDQDLGLHIHRTQAMSEGMRLTEFVQNLRKILRISAKIVPMADDLVQTQLHSRGKIVTFQEYFVKFQTKLPVDNVIYKGNKHSTPPEVLKLLDAHHIIIGPSNPITSIGPILSMKSIEKKLRSVKGRTVAISPLRQNKAYSGPTAQLMRVMGYKVNNVGIAKFYTQYISKLIIDSADREDKSAIEDYDIEVIDFDLEMKSDEQKDRLAREILNIL